MRELTKSWDGILMGARALRLLTSLVVAGGVASTAAACSSSSGGCEEFGPSCTSGNPAPDAGSPAPGKPSPGPTGCARNSDCSAAQICSDGQCVEAAPAVDACVPSCAGRSCGSNGCGGSCGSCPSGETCGSNGTCTSSRVCTATGQACGIDGDCCNFEQGTGFCVNYGNGGLCADSCHANADCTSGCCQTTQQGNQVCAPSSFCAGLVLGAPCTTSSECASGVCANGGAGQGWCTETCTSNASCPSSPFNMWCGQNSAGSDICWVACTSNSSCAQYGSASVCQTVTTIDGFQTSVCVN